MSASAGKVTRRREEIVGEKRLQKTFGVDGRPTRLETRTRLSCQYSTWMSSELSQTRFYGLASSGIQGSPTTSTSLAPRYRAHHRPLIQFTIATMQRSCSPSSASSLLTAVRLGRSSASSTPLRRHISDVTITRTGKPIIRTQGGRSVFVRLHQSKRF